MGIGGTTPVSQTTRTELPNQVRNLMKLGMPFIREWANNDLERPSGSGVAGFTKENIAGQNAVLGSTGTMTDVLKSAAAANQRMTSGELLDPNTNPGLRGTIDAASRPIIQNLLESALPNLRGSAATTGNYGSSRQGIAEGLATGRAADAVGDASSRIAFSGYQSGLDAMGKGTAMAPTIAQAQAIPGMTVSGVGDVRRNMNQAQLDDQRQGFWFDQMAPLMKAQQIFGLLSGVPGGSTTTTGTAPQQNPLMMGLGGALMGSQLLSSLPGAMSGASAGFSGLASILPFLGMSDRRTKRDVEHIGALTDGTPLYSFRYLGSDEKHIGVMADEVAPDCVIEVEGFKMVNYARVVERAMEAGR